MVPAEDPGGLKAAMGGDEHVVQARKRDRENADEKQTRTFVAAYGGSQDQRWPEDGRGDKDRLHTR